MLYNPDWARLPSFKAFVEKQNPSELYVYSNSMDCACAKYLKSTDEFTPDWLSNKDMTGLNRLAGGLPEMGESSNWTFGQLLDRINAKEKELA